MKKETIGGGGGFIQNGDGISDTFTCLARMMICHHLNIYP